MKQWQNFQAFSKVKACIEQHVREVAATLENSLDKEQGIVLSPEERSQCVTSLGRIAGVLRMMECHELALLADEIKGLLEDIAGPAAEEGQQIAEVLQLAFVALTDFPALLEGVLSGQIQHWHGLSHIFNRIRKIRNRSVVFGSQTLLTKKEINFSKLFTDNPAYLKALVDEQLKHYEAIKKRLYSNGSVIESVRELHTLFFNLEVMHRDFRLATLWGVCAAIAEALPPDQAHAENPTVKLLGSFYTTMQTVSEKGIKALNQNIPVEFLDNILQALTRPYLETEQLLAIRCWFNLDLNLAKSRRKSNQELLVSYNRKDAFAKAIRLLTERAGQLSEQINEALSDSSSNPQALEKFTAELSSIQGAISALGMTSVVELLAACTASSPGAVSASSGATVSADKIAEYLDRCAQTLYQCELALQRHAEELERAVFVSRAGKQYGTALTGAKLAVVLEVIKNLEQVVIAINDYAEADWDLSKLVEVPKLLRGAGAVLQTVPVASAANFCVVAGKFAETRLASAVRPDQDPTFDATTHAFAHLIISAILYLEQVSISRLENCQRIEQECNAYLETLIGITRPVAAADGVDMAISAAGEGAVETSGVVAADTADISGIEADEFVPDADPFVSVSVTVMPAIEPADFVLNTSAFVAGSVAVMPVNEADELARDAGAFVSASVADMPASAPVAPDEDANAAATGEVAEFVLNTGDEAAASIAPAPASEVPEPAMAAQRAEEHPVSKQPDSITDEEDEIRAIFVEEALEVLVQINDCHDVLARQPQDKEALADLRRSYHTLKGSGRMVGAEAVAALAWSVENLLNNVISGRVQAETALFAALRPICDRQLALVTEFQAKVPSALDVSSVAQDVARVDAFLTHESPVAAPQTTAKVTDVPAASATAIAADVAPEQTTAMAAEASNDNTAASAIAAVLDEAVATDNTAVINADVGAAIDEPQDLHKVETLEALPQTWSAPEGMMLANEQEAALHVVQEAAQESAQEVTQVVEAVAEELAAQAGQEVLGTLTAQTEFTSQHTSSELTPIAGNSSEEAADHGNNAVEVTSTTPELLSITSDKLTVMPEAADIQVANEQMTDFVQPVCIEETGEQVNVTLPGALEQTTIAASEDAAAASMVADWNNTKPQETLLLQLLKSEPPVVSEQTLMPVADTANEEVGALVPPVDAAQTPAMIIDRQTEEFGAPAIITVLADVAPRALAAAVEDVAAATDAHDSYTIESQEIQLSHATLELAPEQVPDVVQEVKQEVAEEVAQEIAVPEEVGVAQEVVAEVASAATQEFAEEDEQVASQGRVELIETVEWSGEPAAATLDSVIEPGDAVVPQAQELPEPTTVVDTNIANAQVGASVIAAVVDAGEPVLDVTVEVAAHAELAFADASDWHKVATDENSSQDLLSEESAPLAIEQDAVLDAAQENTAEIAVEVTPGVAPEIATSAEIATQVATQTDAVTEVPTLLSLASDGLAEVSEDTHTPNAEGQAQDALQALPSEEAGGPEIATLSDAISAIESVAPVAGASDVLAVTTDEPISHNTETQQALPHELAGNETLALVQEPEAAPDVVEEVAPRIEAAALPEASGTATDSLSEILDVEFRRNISSIRQYLDGSASVDADGQAITSTSYLIPVHTLYGNCRVAELQQFGTVVGRLERLLQDHPYRKVSPGLQALLSSFCELTGKVTENHGRASGFAVSADLQQEITVFLLALEQARAELAGVGAAASDENETVATRDETDASAALHHDALVLQGFLQEARTLNAGIQNLFTAFRQDRVYDKDLAGRLRDQFTLFEGAASAGDQQAIAPVCRELALAYQQYADGLYVVSDPVIFLLDRCHAHINACMNSLESGAPVATLADDLQVELKLTIAQLIFLSKETNIQVAEEKVEDSLLEVFIEEAGEILRELDSKIADWQQAPEDKNIIDDLLRSLHTLKGSAALVGERELSESAHRFESCVIESGKAHRNRDASFFAEVDRHLNILQVLFALYHTDESGRLVRATMDEAELASLLNMDAVQNAVTEVAAVTHISPVTAQEPQVEEAVSQAAEQQSAGGAAESSADAKVVAIRKGVTAGAAEQPGVAIDEHVRVSANLLKSLLNDADEISIARNRIEQTIADMQILMGDMEETLGRIESSMNSFEFHAKTRAGIRHVETGNAKVQGEAPVTAAAKEFDALEMDKYTELQQIVLSLLEDYNDVMDIKNNVSGKIRSMGSILVEQQRSTNKLQEGLVSSQMVPFAGIAPRLRRLVRQVSGELEKQVTITFGNPEGKVDRSVLQALVNPIEHMIRNAIDHGIESTKERLAAGKQGQGELLVKLYRQGANILLDITDDGRGINTVKVRQKAIAQGLLKEGDAVTEQELCQFILRAGFSTSDTVSRISGRGVGLDVVQDEISQIGGDIEIVSTPGLGTTFRIRLPLTSSLNRALLFSVSGADYVMLLNTIDGIILEKNENLMRCHSEETPAFFKYGDKSYELAYLGSLLDEQAVPEFQGGKEASSSLVLVSGTGKNLALHVDSVIGSRELMVKSLGAQFSGIPVLTGGVILGDGRVVVVLDPRFLVDNHVARKVIPASPARAGRSEVAAPEFESGKTVMVVDDSITVRKITSAILKRNGMNVILAKNGIEACELLQTTRPDIMLLDIEMPKMDGFEVAAYVRRQENGIRDLPIIMITSRIGEKHRSRAEEIGVNQYMCKPFQEVNLLEAIAGYN